MPIRFRCAYCNQLMGIAKRKAGSVVRCPKCAGQVIVPHPGPGAAAPGPANGPQGPPPAAGPALFERSDFGQLFQPGPPAPPPPVNPGAFPQPVPAVPEGVYDVEPLGSPEALGPGLFLTPTKLTVVSVAIVILLGLAFFLGFLLGRP